MLLSYFEIAIFAALTLCIITIVVGFKIRKIRSNRFALVVVVLGLINVFIGIRLFFNYPGIFYNSQIEDASNYVLGATDWLSFLGSYLGFAGSLVMAYLVYLQSKFINDITVSEYNPSINMIISLCSKSTDYKEFRDNDIIQSDPNDLNNQYYTFHCAHNNVEQNKYEEFGILIFAEIITTSRISISQLSFLSIEINGTQANRKKFEYVNLGGKWDPAQLGHTVHQKGHIGPKVLFDCLQGGVGILHHIVQQRRRQGVGIHAQVHQDGGHLQRMGDIRLARDALLPLVGLFRKMIGLCDLLHIGKGRVLLHLFQQGLQAIIHLAQRLLAAFQFALKWGKAPVVPIHFTHIATTCSIPVICWLRPAVSVYGSR